MFESYYTLNSGYKTVNTCHSPSLSYLWLRKDKTQSAIACLSSHRGKNISMPIYKNNLSTSERYTCVQPLMTRNHRTWILIIVLREIELWKLDCCNSFSTFKTSSKCVFEGTNIIAILYARYLVAVKSSFSNLFNYICHKHFELKLGHFLVNFKNYLSQHSVYFIEIWFIYSFVVVHFQIDNYYTLCLLLYNLPLVTWSFSPRDLQACHKGVDRVIFSPRI